MSSYSKILRQVRENYRKSAKRSRIDESASPLQIHLLKPLSLYLTPPFLQLGVSPNQVTWLGFAVGAAACLLLATGLPTAVVAGAWLYFAHRVLDHVDGNIARYTGTTSYYGHFLDSSLGVIIQVGLFFCIGLGASRQVAAGAVWGAQAFAAHPEFLLAAGAITSLLLLVTRYVKLDYRWTLANASRSGGEGEASGSAGPGSERRRRRAAGRLWNLGRRLRGLVPLLRVPGLIAAAHADALIPYLLFFALYIPAAFGVQYARLLQLGRRSLPARETRMDLVEHRTFEIG